MWKLNSENQQTQKGKLRLKLLDSCSITAHRVGLRPATSWTHHADALPIVSSSPSRWPQWDAACLPSTTSYPGDPRGPWVPWAQDMQVPKPKTLPKTSPWIWARKHGSGLECWRQHPHWGLTSAAGLEDASPRALGHRQSREYLRGGESRRCSDTRAGEVTGSSADNTTSIKSDLEDYLKCIQEKSNMTEDITASLDKWGKNILKPRWKRRKFSLYQLYYHEGD